MAVNNFTNNILQNEALWEGAEIAGNALLSAGVAAGITAATGGVAAGPILIAAGVAAFKSVGSDVISKAIEPRSHVSAVHNHHHCPSKGGIQI